MQCIIFNTDHYGTYVSNKQDIVNKQFYLYLYL